MRITRATLGMAPADYVTNCSDCRSSLVKARGDQFYHLYNLGETPRILCRDCAGHHCLEAHIAQGEFAALYQTAANIRETRSH